jgi:hypothetical protein
MSQPGKTYRRMNALQLLACVAVVLALRCPAEEELGFRTKYVRDYQATNTSITSFKVDHAPKLDGTLNDPLWKQAGKTEGAFVLFPSRTPAGRQTVAYVCHDDKAIYISLDNEETELDQQLIDHKEIGYGDHVGVLFEVGDTRGRGARCKIICNRSGYSMQGSWKKAELAKDDYKCVYGPNRWIVQMAIPFSSFPGTGQAALRGELWGIKLVRFGKTLDTGASRMRTSWPHINAISEDVAANNGKLFFQSDNMLENSTPALKDGTATLNQTVKVRPESRFSIEWTPEMFSGSVSVNVKGKTIATHSIGDAVTRLDFQQPKNEAEASIAIALKGEGKPPAFRMSFLLDDVPQDYVCLTNNDWVPTRNLKQRVADSGEGRYTYLKPWQGMFGYSIYRSQGCPDAYVPGQKNAPSTYVGRPTQEPLPFPPKRPDIGEDEVENFPWQSVWEDGYVPELVGMPMSSFDEGGKSGWIPFSKGSLTGKDSWAGWPVDRWAGAAPHDVLIDLPGKYYIRRLDILFITTSFRNMEIYVKPEGKPESDFILIYKDIGPGTGKPYGYGAIPPYISIQDLDSVASQVRICLKLDRGDTSTGAPFNNKFGRVNCQMDLFGIAEIWLWGERVGEHTDADIKFFKPVMPPEKPALIAQKLSKLPEPLIWPRPKSAKRLDGIFNVSAETAIRFAASDRLPAFAQQIKDDLARRYLTDVKMNSENAASAIWLGVAGLDPAFDELCKKENVEAPDHPQGYALKVTADKIILAGRDVEGVCWGVQSLLQWADHDEKNAFFRGIEIRDYPLIPLRTIIPSTDHRNPLYPTKSNVQNYYRLMDGLARNRLTGIANWTPASAFQSESTTLKMMRYAYDRGIEVRPVAFFNSFPGEMLEANPDLQPEGNSGLGGDDGTWETQNICPSSPVTYRVIEDLVEKSAKLQPYARYVEFGYLGSHSARYNVCRRCVNSGKTDAALYQEFINRVTQICAKKNLTPVFTNAFMYGGAKVLGEGTARGAAIPNVARDVMLRIDRPMKQAEMEELGFCELARPWETPKNFLGEGAYHGGAAFFAQAPKSGWKEATLIEGDDCHYGWSWNRALSSSILLFAEQTWNGPAPENKPATRTDYEAYSLAAVNACVRFNEQISSGHEYPSWRTGMKPAFFSVDISKACTRSHIDDGIAAGLGRSGKREGWIANGASFDFRRVPLGENIFADVPFSIIDPAQNDWKSVVFVGSTAKEYLIPKSTQRSVIPIGKKAASLCVLRCPVGMGVPAGHMHPQQILPSYTFEYADGTRFVCDRELPRNTVPLTCGNPRTFMPNAGNTLGGELMTFLDPNSRVAFTTNTLSGAGATLFLNEFVNPYPEKDISNLIVALPNPEQKEFTLTVHDAIFAVTGVAPTEWDVRFWKAQPPAPLLPPNAQVAENARPLLKTCEWQPQGRRFVDATSKAPVASLNEPGGVKLPTWDLTFNAPQNVAAIGYRLSMPGAYSNPMPVRLRHADVTLQVLEGKEWKDVATVRGSTAMDGEQIVACNRKGVSAIRVVLNSAPYNQDEESTAIGVLAMETYVQP